MKDKYSIFLALMVLSFYVISCTPAQPAASTPAPEVKPSPQQQATPQPAAQKQEVSAEVSELLEKSKTRVKNVYYKYKGPETGDNFHDFYVKGGKIKYLPYLAIKTLDKPESFDTVFIDKAAGTAESYCIAAYCKFKGKKQDLSYGDAYIQTVLDWIEGPTQAKKVGEEVIDDRATWKIETNRGILWVDTFYGIPLKAESGGKTYRFQQISANSVQDSDVVPK
ncbi:hypothetical protein J4204_05325 [Candidatus Woesearchaeota archaeon]|nr:hypothetical protein [Candidatus Woesearchaeota archaeon]